MNLKPSDQPTTLLAYPLNLVVKPNAWSCIATSFAMVLGITVDEFFSRLGHDGSRRLYASLPDPAGRLGIHVQECIYVAMQYGKAVTPVELFPVHQSRLDYTNTPVVYHGSVTNNWSRFQELIATTRGVVTGSSRLHGHAAAYSHGVIYDPDKPEEYPYSIQNCELRGFTTQCLWIVT